MNINITYYIVGINGDNSFNRKETILGKATTRKKAVQEADKLYKSLYNQFRVIIVDGRIDD